MLTAERIIARVAPGGLVVLAVALVALILAGLFDSLGLGGAAIAVFLGLIIGNLLGPRPALERGTRFAAHHLLAAAVALLGLQIAFADALRFGLPLLVAVVAVAIALLSALLLGRAMGVPARFAILVGAGTGVCGASAIAAVRPVVGASEAETTYAVGAVTLLGSIGLVVFPLIQLAWHPFAAESFGMLAGGALHSVPQAIGAGFAGGGEPGGTLATVVKLTRVALLLPLVLILAWGRTREARARGTKSPVPIEVWGFLVFFLLGNLFPVPMMLRSIAADLTGLLLIVALAALGLRTRFTALRAAGTRPVVLALAVWLVLVSVVFLFLVYAS